MNLKCFVIALFLLSVFSCSYEKPTKPRVDYIRASHLTVIKSFSPIFSWQLDDKLDYQTAYQIIISTDSICAEGDVWNSGKIDSENNYAVSYQGDSLEADKSYYWKVRYWSGRYKKSSYSDPQKFTIASIDQCSESIVTENPLLRREDTPVSFKEIAECEYLFDFGRSAFGAINFKFEAQQDTILTIRVGEQLTLDGYIERNPEATIRYQEVEVPVKKGTYEYKVDLPADSRNTGSMAIPVPEEWGVIMPFRYIEVSHLQQGEVERLELKRDVVYGYRELLGSFKSSNSLLDSIWEISRYTIETTDFLGYYIDGDRERIPYEADAYLNQLSHYCIDSEYAIAKKTLEYFMDHATWPTEWLLHTVMIANLDYIYTGDTRLLEQYYDIIKAKSLYKLGREDGLISAKNENVTPEYLESIGFKAGFKLMRDIVDWPKDKNFEDGKESGERDGHEMLPINTVVNCFHYNAIVQMSQIAAAIGNIDDAKFFARRASLIKRSINEKLFDSQLGIYIDGEGSSHSSIHSNMFALAFDVIEEDKIGKVVEFIKSRGMACSVYGAQYLFEALYKAGEAQYALDLMTNKSDRGWYNMIRVGSTMTLEAWDLKYKYNLDWNHAWGAAPANIIPRYMWGITPLLSGYRSAIIKPQLADLESSEIAVPTLQGVIKGLYLRQGDVKEYTLYIPANMQATFSVVDDAKSIMVNGRICEKRECKLKKGENKIVVIL